MSQLKKCQVVMLPTEKATGLFIKIQDLWGKYITISERKLEFTTNETLIKNNHLISSDKAKSNAQDKYIFNHLYIISNDEIKKGDWCLAILTNTVFQVKEVDNSTDEIYYKAFRILCPKRNCKKIIATTDKLYGRYNENIGSKIYSENYRLPQPSDSFIQKFIEEYNKGNIITDVMVEYEIIGNCKDPMICLRGCAVHDGTCKQLINRKDILKINPKDNTITIRPIKDNWSREEVIKLIDNYITEKDNFGIDKDKWIKENL